MLPSNRLLMGRFCSFLLGGCTRSLYWTSPRLLGDDDQGLSDKNHIFIAPYFAEIENEMIVSIVPSSAPKSDVSDKDASPTPSPAPPPTFTLAVIPVPVSRAYLYMSKNSLFTNSANVGVGSDGLLTSSDSSSAQQITTMLTELAQTAVPFLTGQLYIGLTLTAPKVDPRQMCKAEVDVLTSAGSYSVRLGPIASDVAVYSFYDDKEKDVRINLALSIPPSITGQQVKVNSGGHAGLVVLFPLPTIAEVTCTVNGATTINMTAPSIVNLHLVSHVVDPKRDFLTSPQDTYTFNEGFITGHNVSNQSSVKTVVDTITMAICALMPSVQVTTTTQVQTGGGKPAQTTKTTASQVSPSKDGGSQ